MATPLHRINPPSASVVTVTPELAKLWLEHNKVNRKVRDARVRRYAKDMSDGQWRLTGEAIKFSHDGTMIDGQHRCWAVIESGVHVPMFVISGLDGDTQGVIDSGSARTAADNLHMAGIKNANLVASIARRRISLRNFNDVTNSEVYDYVHKHRADLDEAVAIAHRCANKCDIVPSVAGLAAWRIAEVHGWRVANEFFTAASEKVGLAPGDPVIAMTDWFAERRRKKVGARHYPLEAQLSVIIRAFNYRYQNRPLRQIKASSAVAAGTVIPIPAVVSK